MNDVKDKVEDVFKQVFDDDSIEIFDEMTAENVEAWTSMAHINLIFMLEQVFKIRFNTEEIGVIQSVGELTKAIEDKLAPDSIGEW